MYSYNKQQGDNLILADYKIWKPTPGQPINLEASVDVYFAAHLQRAGGQGQRDSLYDPYQLARSMQTLTASGIAVSRSTPRRKTT